jgi:hypothetical protein
VDIQGKFLGGKGILGPTAGGGDLKNIFNFLRHLTPLPHTAKRRYGTRAPLAGWLYFFLDKDP